MRGHAASLDARVPGFWSLGFGNGVVAPMDIAIVPETRARLPKGVQSHGTQVPVGRRTAAAARTPLPPPVLDGTPLTRRASP